MQESDSIIIKLGDEIGASRLLRVGVGLRAGQNPGKLAICFDATS